MDENTKTSIESGKLAPKDLPAGHERDEAKRIATDALEERAESDPREHYAFDPSKIQVENEIAQHYNLHTNEFEVTDALDDYAYLWVFDHHNSVTEVKTRVQRLLGNRVPGYELVNGSQDKFPECWHLRDANGYRRIGDVILFRVLKRVKEALDDRNAQMNRARQAGVGDSLLQRANRYGKYARATVTEGDPHDTFRERAQRGGVSSQEFDREMVKSMAVHQLAEDARNGRLHGLPVERALARR